MEWRRACLCRRRPSDHNQRQMEIRRMSTKFGVDALSVAGWRMYNGLLPLLLLPLADIRDANSADSFKRKLKRHIYTRAFWFHGDCAITCRTQTDRCAISIARPAPWNVVIIVFFVIIICLIYATFIHTTNINKRQIIKQNRGCNRNNELI